MLAYRLIEFKRTKTNVCGLSKSRIDTFVLMEFGLAFGQVLKAHRTEAGYSQEELAFRAEMHSTTISMYERGGRQPTLHTLFILAKALDVEPVDLVAELQALKPKFG